MRNPGNATRIAPRAQSVLRACGEDSSEIGSDARHGRRRRSRGHDILSGFTGAAQGLSPLVRLRQRAYFALHCVVRINISATAPKIALAWLEQGVGKPLAASESGRRTDVPE